MRKYLQALFVIIATLLIISGEVFAAAGTCTQSIAKTGDNAVLTFVCTAGSADHLYPSTAVSDSILSQIKGYYITEVRTSPGGTAPTDASTVVINTGDSPVFDILGGVATCSATLTTRFIPKLNATSGVYGRASIINGLTLVLAANSVNSAVITVKVVMWRN
jgi:hypothetical protein